MENNNTQSDRGRYRNSFAATILFSGVQIYQIIIRIVKSKFLALFIGPTGIGIQSLLRSTTDTISVATNFGLKTSSIKSIAAANRDGEKYEIAKTITVLRRLIWITGLLGLFICAVLAPVWSKTSFGDLSYIWSFVAVSLIILIDQLNNGELALLQGLQLKKQLARANILGQTLNAALTIPLYYLFGVKAIVMALILGSLITLIITKFYTRKIKIEKINISWHETFSVGRDMIKLGVFLSMQLFLTQLVAYLIRNYVSNVGGVDEVGLYSAGTMIIVSYIGLVFTAIGTDYYPRLAAVKSNEEMAITVRTQADLMTLLLTPLVIAFIVFSKPAIIILYSDQFLPIEHMMYWSIGAVLFQAMGWAMSYTLLAKAKPSQFFLNELIAACWGVPIKLLCYKVWGLTGFGMATFVCNVLYFIQILVVTKKLFNLSYDIAVLKQFAILHLPVVSVVLVKLLLSEIFGYIAGFVIFVITIIVIIYRLNRRMDLKSYINRKFIKKHA